MTCSLTQQLSKLPSLPQLSHILLFFILDMSNNKRTANHPTDILSKGGPPPLLISLPKPKLPLASISAPNSISDLFLALCTARRSTYLTYLTYWCSIQLAHPFFGSFCGAVGRERGALWVLWELCAYHPIFSCSFCCFLDRQKGILHNFLYITVVERAGGLSAPVGWIGLRRRY